MNLPVLDCTALYRIGPLRSVPEPTSGQEGHLLPVSQCPQAWQQIARLGGRPLLHLSKRDACPFRLLDMHRVRELPEHAMILEWAVRQDLISSQMRYRYWSTDEEGDWQYGFADTECDAIYELGVELNLPEGPAGKRLVEPLDCFIGTAKMAERIQNRTAARELAEDMAVILWAEEFAPDRLDGAYWDELLDPCRLSAPRAGLFLGGIESLVAEQLAWDEAPDDDALFEVAQASSGFVNDESLEPGG